MMDSPGDFVEPTTFHMSMADHLKQVNTAAVDESSVGQLAQYCDEDFFLDQLNKPTIVATHFPIESPESVFLIYARPEQYQIVKSDYSAHRPRYVAWKSVKESHSTDFGAYLQTYYRSEYEKLNGQIKFYPIASPSFDKMHNLNRVRTQLDGRSIFHYVGYGFPQMSKGSFYISEAGPDNSRPFYPLKRVFESISQPSWFIFDCDNSGSALECFQKLSSHSKDQEDDWFCFCATGVDETLPEDANLPRDFLTTCLLTPIQLSILCHVIRFYRNSFQCQDFPLGYIEHLSKAKSIRDLGTALSIITDAIAADYLDPKLYKKLFRRDQFIATFFSRFILFQFLMSYYEVHPISHPAICNTSSHPLWQQWEAFLDLWVMSSTMPKISFSTDLFVRASATFETLLATSGARIDPSLLAIHSRYPFLKPEHGDQAFIPLAEFAAKSAANRIEISNAADFELLIKKLLSHTADDQQYQALCYVTLSVLHANKEIPVGFGNSVVDIELLASHVFDESFSQPIRSMMAAIVATLGSAKTMCTSREFMEALKNEIPKADVALLLWMLILFKRSYGFNSADLDMFYNSSCHLQVASCIFHKAHEIRAATASALSCFMQTSECITNAQLLLFAIRAFNDMSYLVRYQLLILIIRFFSSFSRVSTYEAPYDGSLKSFSEFQMRLFGTIPLTFTEYAMAVDKLTHMEGCSDYVHAVARFMIDYFCKDPHPSISTLALRAKRFYLAPKDYGSEKPAIASESMSPPFHSILWNQVHPDMEEDEKEQQNEENFESDSNALYNISMRQLVNSGPWQEPNASFVRRSSVSRSLGCIDMPRIKLELCNKSPSLGVKLADIAFHPREIKVVTASTDKCIHSLDDDFNPYAKVKMESEVTCLKTGLLYGSDFVIMSTADGCSHIWNPSRSNLRATWRTDANFADTDVRCVHDVAQSNSTIVTARGVGGAAVWDAETQQLCGEWLSEERGVVTDVRFYPGENNICAAAYENGIFAAFDVREPQTSRIVWMNLGEKIIGISGNRTGSDKLFTMTQSGKCFVWDMKSNQVSTCMTQKKVVSHFESHYSLPLIAMKSPKENPVIYSTKGTLLKKVNLSGAVATLSFHPILPVVTFGMENGSVECYNIMLDEGVA